MSKLNLDYFPKFCRSSQIVDKDGRRLPLVFNISQQVMVQKLSEEYAKKRPLWFIVLKSRQIGASTVIEALISFHCWAFANVENRVVAHDKDSSLALFAKSRLMRESFAEKFGIGVPKPLGTELEFPHGNGPSFLDVATAGSTSAGRGMTRQALHVSEAAFIRPESYLAMINTVHMSQNTIVAQESTANGEVGVGETFFKTWQDAVAGENDYIPIFIPWTVDPECRLPSAHLILTKDELQFGKDYRLDPEQLAWRRWVLKNKCQGSATRFNQEYPVTPEIAFVFSEDPAFLPEEIASVRQGVLKPLEHGWMEFEEGTPRFVPLRNAPGKGDARAPLRIFSWPQEGHEYYLGADPARGIETGDFAAVSVFDGTTGEQVAEMNCRISPLELKVFVAGLGFFYNTAMIAVEVNSHGLEVQTYLRDEIFYPNIYGWKGKDDKLKVNTNATHGGWETTWKSREIGITNFREMVKGKRIVIRSAQLFQQMGLVRATPNYRFEVEKGHDDIFFAALIAAMAIRHYPPMGGMKESRNLLVNDETVKEHFTFELDPRTALLRHWDNVRTPKVERWGT